MSEYWRKELFNALKIVFGITIITFIIVLFFYDEFNWEVLKTQLFYNIYYGLPLSLVNGYFFDTLDNFVTWKESITRRAIIGAIGSVVLTMATVFLLNMILWVWIMGSDYGVLTASENRGFYVVALIITLVVSTVFHAYFFLKELVHQTKVNAELKQEHLKSQLSALRAHIDPHFLFNSFNVLSGLIDEDKEKAQEFLAGLSGIYRHIMEHRESELTTIESELEFARKYYVLLSMRFENSVILEISIDDAAKVKSIPTLTLQLLLENTIKHNKFSVDMPLRIQVKLERDYLVVKNNINKRELNSSTKMGLANIRNRYQLLSDREIIVVENDQFFIVKLPIL